MGNYATCKKYTQKEKNQFILLTRSHFSLIAKKLCRSRNTDPITHFNRFTKSFRRGLFHPLLEIEFLSAQIYSIFLFGSIALLILA